MAASSCSLIRGERLPDRDPAVEVDDLREVVRLQPLHEVRRGYLKRRQLVLHARAAVEQQGEGNWLRPPREEDDVVLDAVLEHGKVGLIEVRNVMVGAVDYGDVERDDVDGAPKLRALCGGQCGCGRKDDHRAEYVWVCLVSRQAPVWPRAGVPRMVTPVRADATSTFSGGISDSGRP